MEELDQVLNEEEGLFDDYVEDDTPVEENEIEEEVKTETEETIEEKIEEQVEAKPFLKVRFNGEDKEVNEEEARTYTQKGMNYDRLYDKYMNEHGELERIAKLNGMNVDNFIRSLGDTQVQYEIKKEIDNLKTQNPDAPEELLKELAEKRVTERFGNYQRDAEIEQKELADAQLEAVRNDVNFLKSLYPDFDPENVPQEVFDNVDKGMDLVKAYLVYQKQRGDQVKPQVEAQAKIDKLNEENKKKSLGSTTNAGSQEQDDFLSGFLNG